MTTITQKLDQLADLETKRDVLKLQMKEELVREIPAEILERWAAIEAKYEAQDNDVSEQISALEAEVRAAVLAGGESVKGKYLMVVWNKGRVSWDGNKLDGMMSLIPQLKDARKEGKPTVSIRRVEP